MRNLVSVIFQVVISVISFNPGLPRENKMEVISHHFLLPVIREEINTFSVILYEWLVFSLGQCVLDCPGAPYCFMTENYEALVETIDINDLPRIHEIVDWLQEQHEILFSDPVFQSICFSNLEFYKFSYELYPTPGRILFHVDEE